MRRTQESNPVGLAPMAAFEAAAVTMRPFSVATAPKAGIEPTDTWARTRLVAITTRDRERASGRSRTCDLLLFREALFRLSY